MSPLELVRAFAAAWDARDLDAICAALSDDVVYVNVGMSEVAGLAAVRDFLAPFVLGAERIAWTIHHDAETPDGVVLNERTDDFVLKPEGGGRTITIGVMGVFEVRDGKIARWRDYFDVATFRAQMA